MKLYQKISRVCCRLYCYECTAWVTMSTATNEWYFSGIAWYYGEWFCHTNLRFQWMFRCSVLDLQYLIWIFTWLVVLIWILTWLVVLMQIFAWLAVKNTAFYKLIAAARLPHWLTFTRVRRMINIIITSLEPLPKFQCHFKFWGCGYTWINMIFFLDL